MPELLPAPTNVIPPKDEWSETEKWVWEKITKGEVADFNQKFKQLDPKVKEGWSDKRVISPEFIETILLKEPYKNTLPRRGFRIAGALLKRSLDLFNASIISELWMDDSRFEENVDLTSLRSTNFISFENSFFVKDLIVTSAKIDREVNFSGITVEGRLILESVIINEYLLLGQSSLKDVTLVGARIHSDLSFLGASAETLNMDSISVGGHLHIGNNGKFKNIILNSASISAELSFSETTVLEELSMVSISISGHLFLETSQFKIANLKNIKVDGDVYARGTTVLEKLDMNSASIKGSVYLDSDKQSGVSSFKKIDLVNAKVEGNVNLSGVKVSEEVNMNSSIIKSSVFMDSTIESGTSEFQKFDLGAAKIGGGIYLSGAKIMDELNMNSICVEDSVFMSSTKESGVTEIKSVDLGSGKIKGHLNLLGAIVSEQLNMNIISIGGTLFMNSDEIAGFSEFKNVDLLGAKIEGMINMAGARIIDEINMNSISVNGNLFMSAEGLYNNSEFDKIDLGYARIRGTLEFTAAKMNKLVDLTGATIVQNINFAFGESAEELNLTDTSVGGNLFFSGGKFSKLNLGGAKINGELFIDVDNWTENSFLNLCNAQIGALQDGGENSWPAQLDLDGLKCSRLGGVLENKSQEINIAERDHKWFVAFLEKDKTFSPQPYHHFAELLYSMGHSEKANAVLYAAKNREKKIAYESGHFLKGLGFTILDWTIGYGLGARYFRSLIWVTVLTMIGIFVLGTIDSMQSRSFGYKAGFSLDMLLPIIELNKDYTLYFSGWQLTYFYFHELMGFLLGSFVLAGLSGITKK